MAKKKATSSDVAKKAGVSQATVSMVLNKKYNGFFFQGNRRESGDGSQRIGISASWPQKQKRK